LLTFIVMAMGATGAAHAQDDDGARGGESTDSLDGPDEPTRLLRRIEERGAQRDSLLPVSPLGWLRDATGEAKDDLYDATGLKLGTMLAHVFQGISDKIPGEDAWGTATTMDLVAAWHLLHRDEPTVGQLVGHLQMRWDYDTTGPEDLGANSLASAIGTADTFAKYSQLFVYRNLYWRQGSAEAGWVYRLGKITPDSFVNTSSHLASDSNFLPSGGTGAFAIAYPDSGLGAAAAWHFNDRVALGGLVSDANGDRLDFGDIDKGDVFVAGELQVKVFPRTPKAPYSKFTIWHTDGTEERAASNAMLGPSGWGVYAMHQQELTADGRAIAILRFGKSFNDSAVYDRQAAVHLLLYEPRVLTRLKNDLIGAAFNWAKTPLTGARSEYNVEVFYRFPIFPHVDTTLSYQSVINPAFTRDVHHASVFSFRIRTTF
jgi:hypothetical protein